MHYINKLILFDLVFSKNIYRLVKGWAKYLDHGWDKSRDEITWEIQRTNFHNSVDAIRFMVRTIK